MNSVSVDALEQANLSRTKYLLKNYYLFFKQSDNQPELKISKAVMEILSFALSGEEHYSAADEELIDSCGLFLAPAILGALEEIRTFPYEVFSKVYPILHCCYFHPDGPAVDIHQLAYRISQQALLLTHEEIKQNLEDGERMMSSLLFHNKMICAIKSCT